jgi:hypothetical protein
MRNLLLISMTLLCITLSWGCKKKPATTWEDLPYYPMDEEFKSYFAPAQPGSWWVYYDSAQNIYDTVRIEQVTGISGKIDNEDPLEGYRYDGFAISYSSSEGIPYSINIDVKRGGTGYIMRLNYPGLGSHTVVKEDNNYAYCNKLDSVVVNGITYRDVLEINWGAFEPLWFAKNIGVIYKEKRAYSYGKFSLIDSYIIPNI